MRLALHHISLILVFTFLMMANCFCQSNSKEESKIFDKKPTFDTTLNDFAKPIGYVNDYGGLYTPEQIFEMDSLIYDFETKTSIQLVVITFDSIRAKSNEIDELTETIGKGWRVGGDSSKGLVIGISKPYRRMRIQNGEYIQSILSDSETKEIIDLVFIPEFKNGHYYKGTLFGLKSIMITLKNNLANKVKVQF